jgi:antitoxin component YwqK of YwqJK toxin-antitoxin module
MSSKTLNDYTPIKTKIKNDKTYNLQTFYNNGKTKSIIKLHNGVKYGTQKYYTLEGLLSEKITYKNGKKYGKHSSYENGRLIEKRSFKNEL